MKSPVYNMHEVARAVFKAAVQFKNKNYCESIMAHDPCTMQYGVLWMLPEYTYDGNILRVDCYVIANHHRILRMQLRSGAADEAMQFLSALRERLGLIDRPVGLILDDNMASIVTMYKGIYCFNPELFASKHVVALPADADVLRGIRGLCDFAFNTRDDIVHKDICYSSAALGVCSKVIRNFSAQYEVTAHSRETIAHDGTILSTCKYMHLSCVTPFVGCDIISTATAGQ